MSLVFSLGHDGNKSVEPVVISPKALATGNMTKVPRLHSPNLTCNNQPLPDNDSNLHLG